MAAAVENKHWAKWVDDPMKHGFSRFGKYCQKVIYNDIAPDLHLNPDADNDVIETSCRTVRMRSGELFADLPAGGFWMRPIGGLQHDEVAERKVLLTPVVGSEAADVVLEYLVGIQRVTLSMLWEDVTRAFMRPIFKGSEPKPAIADSLFYSRVAEFKLEVENTCLYVTVVLSYR